MTDSVILPNIDPEKVAIIMIGEALPEDPEDYFYSSTNSLYVTNTVDAFNNAGIKVNSINDILHKGVYLTVVIKEPLSGSPIPSETIKQHSYSLEQEISKFPNVKAILLMGDTAIKAMNYISQRQNKVKAIPSGSTYKIRKGEFYFDKIRVFPSYLQTGKNFLIEKTKRTMVAEDIRNAFELTSN